VNCLSYGKADGMPTLECSGGLQPPGGRTTDGRLWFPTSKGLAVFNPEEAKVNQLPPPVIIENMLADGRTVTPFPVGDAPLHIPPGPRRFEFRYTALSFVVPEKVRFKYRLEGLEPDWVDAGTKRSANYSHIPPGSYTFHVIACNSEGVWNDSGATLAFTVQPYFWQEWRFRIPAGLAAVASLAGAVAGIVLWIARRRMRLKLERLERLRAVERERARIAQDIHDNLGANLTRISLLSQSANSELENPAQAAVQLERIYGTARELTRAMDEIVWAVNPQYDTLDSLASYLGNFAQEFLGSLDIRCRLDVPLQLPQWPVTAEVRHNLFLAFKEALHNVVKHAAASEVQVALKLEANQLTLTVADNGRDFVVNDPAPKPPTNPDRIMHGHGLPNMKRRLAEIGGACEVHGEPGQGTTVTFRVPLRG
jgi:signal transduction histidine kinase